MRVVHSPLPSRRSTLTAPHRTHAHAHAHARILPFPPALLPAQLQRDLDPMFDDEDGQPPKYIFTYRVRVTNVG